MRITIKMKPDDTVDDLIRVLKRNDPTLVITKIFMRSRDRLIKGKFELEEELILDVKETTNETRNTENIHKSTCK